MIYKKYLIIYAKKRERLYLEIHIFNNCCIFKQREKYFERISLLSISLISILSEDQILIQYFL